ncbi:hypothetical protein [Bdellovibrio reynosensis]|uniref:Uncharacterized protein n=1 Tax=Bdellovibrio reynosensis TaxID=2835041 RepID=A0ABY4C5I0_9BACT|nr:hypothetical protein [Bdellovibrio reynosensis]UOF00200.1 hypothetical protein MNR06_10850 [Bdellovibrio reynosensis]
MRISVFIIVIFLVGYFFWNRPKSEVVSSQASISTEENSVLETNYKDQVVPSAVREVAPSHPFASERKKLISLITISRGLTNNPEKADEAQALRDELKSLPNYKEVLWDYYRELQARGAGSFERVEVLDLMVSDVKDPEIADAALKETIVFAPPDTGDAEKATSEAEENRALSTDPSFIPIVVAFEIYLKNCEDYKSCSSGVKEVLRKQQNRNMRSNLVSTLYAVFPQSADEIHRDLRGK